LVAVVWQPSGMASSFISNTFDFFHFLFLLIIFI
jgi:hypothetical protein